LEEMLHVLVFERKDDLIGTLNSSTMAVHSPGHLKLVHTFFLASSFVHFLGILANCNETMKQGTSTFYALSWFMPLIFFTM
jgi:hypothetical protein